MSTKSGEVQLFAPGLRSVPFPRNRTPIGRTRSHHRSPAPSGQRIRKATSRWIPLEPPAKVKPGLRKLSPTGKGPVGSGIPAPGEREGPMELKGKHVAVLAEDLYEDLELWYPVHRFRKAGAKGTMVGGGARASSPRH